MQYLPLGISLGKANSPAEVAPFIEAGFTHFELSVPLSCGSRGHEEDFLTSFVMPYIAALKECDATPWSFHLPFGTGWDIAAFDEEERKQVSRSLQKLIGLLGNFGAKVFVVHGCLEPVIDSERPVRMAHSIQSLRELEEAAKQFGMHIALEDLPRSCLANDTKETFAMMQAAGYVGICFDVNHLLKDTHEIFLDKLAPHIITTHLSDYDGLDEKHYLPGEGVVPWKLVVEKLLDAGYRGPFLFELKQGENGPYTPEEIIDAFENALE